MRRKRTRAATPGMHYDVWQVEEQAMTLDQWQAAQERDEEAPYRFERLPSLTWDEWS